MANLQRGSDIYMARESKKIRRKVEPDYGKKKSDLKPKAPRDRMLLILIALTVFVMGMGYQNLDAIGLAMYATLLISMVIVYINRHSEFSESTHRILTWVSLVTSVSTIGLFGYSTYLNFFAK